MVRLVPCLALSLLRRLRDGLLENAAVALLGHPLRAGEMAFPAGPCAVFLGDRIAVFGPGGALQQYDTPDMILTHPANDFVAEFVGAGAAVRRLSLLELSRLELQSVDLDGTAARNGSPTYEADAEGRPVRWAYLPGTADLPKLVTVPRTGTVYDAVDVMLDSQTELVGVVDEQQRLQGALWWRDLVEGLKTKAGS